MFILILFIFSCSEEPPVHSITPVEDTPLTARNTKPVNESPRVKEEPPQVKLRSNRELRRPYQKSKRAPASFSVVLSTSKGDVLIYSKRDWAPHGVDRLYSLFRINYFDDAAFFQPPTDDALHFGIHAIPKVANNWEKYKIMDDPVNQSNTLGSISFAQAKMPHTRSVRLFVNLTDNRHLNALNYAPVARVASPQDMAILKRIDAFVRSGKIAVPSKRELLANGIEDWLNGGHQ